MNSRNIRLIQILAFASLSTVASAAYEVVAVTGGGRVEGKVTFMGQVPIRKIVPNKDVEVCGGPREEARMTVGSDKGVRDAVVYLKAVPKGKAWAAPDKPLVVENDKCTFKPVVQVMRPGNFDVINSDPVLHTTHGFYGARNAFNIAMPEKGMRMKSDLPRPGLVRIQCDTHNWMFAHIHVADSPYYAVSAADGSFSITDVPPGTYTLVAWQNYTGATETTVTVKGGDAVKAPIELKKE